MKKIIIAGTSRSGKTTLAKKVFCNYPYNWIQSDNLDCAVEKMYLNYMAEFDGKCSYTIDVRELANIKDYLLNWYFYFSINDNIYEGVILDTCLLSMERLKKYAEEGCIVIVLGCSEITTDEFFENVRTYDTPLDRTYHLRDRRLYMELEYCIETSKEYKKDCERLGLTYIETSHNRKDNLEKAYQIIKEKLTQV